MDYLTEKRELELLLNMLSTYMEDKSFTDDETLENLIKQLEFDILALIRKRG